VLVLDLDLPFPVDSTTEINTEFKDSPIARWEEIFY
jgi:hypothetical protein